MRSYSKVQQSGRILFCSIILGVVLLCALGTARADDVLSAQGTKFYLDGKRFEMWGIRTVNALWNETETVEFLEAMVEYKSYGVNTVGINLQGGFPGYEIEPSTGKWYRNSAFNTDGSLKDEYMDRMRRILEKAQELDMVVNLGYFYQRQCRQAATTAGLDYDHWDSEEAIYQAARNATIWLLPYRNVFLDIVNEFGHPGFGYNNVFPDRGSVSESELLAKGKKFIDIVYEIDPDRLCGMSPTSGIGILDIPGADVAYTHGPPQEHLAGNRPQVNNEQLTGGDEGIYSDAEKAAVRSEALLERAKGNYWFWHSGWVQYTPFHFRVDGEGTAENPGDKWVFEFIAQASVQISAQIVKPEDKHVSVGEPVSFEAEAYDEGGYLIQNDEAFSWRLEDIGDEANVVNAIGRSCQMQVPKPGSYKVILSVTDNGQTQYAHSLLIAGDPKAKDFPLGADGFWPALASDVFGRYHLVYAFSDGVHYMTYDQNGWSYDEVIPDSRDADMTFRRSPVIDTDSFGNPHVVWGYNEKLYYSTRQAGSWQQRIELEKGVDNEIAVDSYDNVWVIFRGDPDGNEHVRARRKSAGSAGFDYSKVIYVDNSDRRHPYPAVCAGNAGSVFAVWRWDDMSGSSYDPFFSKYDGSIWSAGVSIDRSDDKIGEGLDIVVNRANVPYITYYARRVWVSHYENATWHKESVGLDWNAESGGHEPRMAIDSGGRIYVVSRQGDRAALQPNNRVLFTTFTPQSGWASPQVISEEAPLGHGQADVAATTNCALVVWKDLRGGLYFRVLGAGSVTENNPPVVSMQASPSTGPSPLAVQFDGSGSYDPDGQITAYYWDFDDGSSSTEKNPLHTYTQPLGYEPKLFVTDDLGATRMDLLYVEVTPGQIEGTINALNHSDYAVAYVQESDYYYVDRDYRVLDIPAAYEGMLWVKTKNDDKDNADLTIRFTVGEHVGVYIAFDSRLPAPAWLTDDFIRTQDVLQVSDAGNSDFRIWQSRRAYDTGESLELGANSAGGIACGMYVVLVGGGGPHIDQTPPASPVGVVVKH